MGGKADALRRERAIQPRRSFKRFLPFTDTADGWEKSPPTRLTLRRGGFSQEAACLPPLLDARITSRPFCSSFNGDHSPRFLLDFNLSCSSGCLFFFFSSPRIKMRFPGKISARCHVGNGSPHAPCAHSPPKSRSVVLKLK